MYKHLPSRRYTLKWLENSGGELYERENIFTDPDERTQFVRDMMATGRLHELVEASEKTLAN